jgi:hypothetical protein
MIVVSSGIGALNVQRVGVSAAAGLGVEWLDQAQQTRPGHDLIHLGEEALAACLLAFTGVFEIGKAHLTHGRLGSGGQAYFSVFEDWFGDSLGGANVSEVNDVSHDSNVYAVQAVINAFNSAVQ